MSRPPPPPLSARATHTIPYTYRVLLTSIEPTFATLGAILNILQPSSYLNTLTHSAVPYDPHTQFLYTSLSGAWLMFAFIEAVVLRAADDARLWRLLACAMLLSDVLYCQSVAEGVGGWAEWVQVGRWTAEDWTVTATTAPFVAARMAIVLGWRCGPGKGGAW